MFNLIAGAVTPFQGKKPSFDIVSFDPLTMVPLNIETYVFDIDYANANDKPRWLLQYDWLEYYKLKDLSPASLYSLSEQINNDHDVCNKYKTHRKMDGPGVNARTKLQMFETTVSRQSCGPEDRLELHCETSSSEWEEWYNCRN